MVLFARDIVEKDFISFTADTDAFTAAKVMKQKSHGYVIVVSSDGTPRGIVTEWDYLSKIVAEGLDPSKITLADIMSQNLITVKSNEGTDVVAQLMAERGIRRVLVLKDRKVIGVITAKTVLANLRDYIDKVSAQIARLHMPQY